jgi:ribosomal protein S18 acetylase RimI-like enzyme
VAERRATAPPQASLAANDEMTPTVQFEILDLRHFSARQLRPLIEEESQQWSTQMRWDYRGSANLLLQYMDSHVLPGYAAMDQGKICGYVFCVHEGSKAVIGDVFASAPLCVSQAPAEVEGRLLTHMLETLQHTPGVDRIESQLLLHPSHLHAELFLEAGFRVYRRLFLECDLQSGAVFIQVPEPPVPQHLHLRKWQSTDFQSAGELITLAYRGHLDSRINNQYRSVSGSLRFLHNIVRFPGCGQFDPDSSWVLADKRTGALEGLLLCSRVRGDVGHITQICVTPGSRKLGLGRLLLQRCAVTLQARGFSVLSLTVTEDNSNAVQLYEHVGFSASHSFDAMVWDPQEM